MLGNWDINHNLYYLIDKYNWQFACFVSQYDDGYDDECMGQCHMHMFKAITKWRMGQKELPEMVKVQDTGL